jgi:hypothetical protein
MSTVATTVLTPFGIVAALSASTPLTPDGLVSGLAADGWPVDGVPVADIDWWTL